LTESYTSNATSVIEVRSASARLFAGTWRPWWVLLQHFIMLRLFFVVECGITRAFSALCVCAKFGHHPHPLGYGTFMPNFVSFATSIAELAYGEKSRTQSLNQSLN